MYGNPTHVRLETENTSVRVPFGAREWRRRLGESKGPDPDDKKGGCLVNRSLPRTIAWAKEVLSDNLLLWARPLTQILLSSSGCGAEVALDPTGSWLLLAQNNPYTMEAHLG